MRDMVKRCKKVLGRSLRPAMTAGQYSCGHGRQEHLPATFYGGDKGTSSNGNTSQSIEVVPWKEKLTKDGQSTFPRKSSQCPVLNQYAGHDLYA